MKKIKKFKKLKNKIKGLSIELDKNTTKLSDLDELDGVIEDFKKETDDRYEVDVNIDSYHQCFAAAFFIYVWAIVPSRCRWQKYFI